MTKQIKSKTRVADHGEVFTAEREVNAMLDLVKQETARVDSRFLVLAVMATLLLKSFGESWSLRSGAQSLRERRNRFR